MTDDQTIVAPLAPKASETALRFIDHCRVGKCLSPQTLRAEDRAAVSDQSVFELYVVPESIMVLLLVRRAKPARCRE